MQTRPQLSTDKAAAQLERAQAWCSAACRPILLSHFLVDCMALGKLLHLSVPRFPYLNTRLILGPSELVVRIK